MGRRRKNNDDGGGGLILAIGLMLTVTGYLFTAIGYVIAGALTVAFYSLPLVMALAAIATRATPEQGPGLPRASDYDPADATDIVARWKRMRIDALERHERLMEAGAENGISLTKASGERRFDTRPRLGRSLNAELDEVDAFVTTTEGRICRTMDLVSSQFPAWIDELNEWIKLIAIRRALRKSLRALPILIAGALLIQTTHLLPVSGLTGTLLWKPAFLPDTIIGPLMAGVFATYGLSYFLFRRAKEDAKMVWVSPECVALTRLHAKWSFGLRGLDAFPDLPSDSEEASGTAGGQSGKAPNAESAKDVWHEVLQVSADAAFDQIRAAYLKAVKEYHPDRVATLGVKLKALAEEELKRINAAYEQAQAVHGK